MVGIAVSASIFIFLSALIIAILGLLHLVYTFRGPKLAPRSVDVRAAMESDSPGISGETTMWRAWLGFNASHSLGALLFGLVYAYLALIHPQLLFASEFLSAVGFAMLTALLILAKRYWFRIPFLGIAVALFLFVAGQIVARM